MRVGWLMYLGEYIGGAEMTQAEFQAAAPDGVDLVACPPEKIDLSCDMYVIQNCVLYEREQMEPLEGKPVFKYWHDVGPHLRPGVRAWLDRHAQAIACSPIQVEQMGLEDAICIPPPVDLSRFFQAAEFSNVRAGAVCIGSWRNYGKAPHRAAEWAQGNGGIDFYGSGPFSPPGSQEVPYEDMPDLLARYERFVFLPMVIEPFGRLVAEAWAAGCEIVTNGLVGAAYWIQENPEAIETAGEDFRRVVLDR